MTTSKKSAADEITEEPFGRGWKIAMIVVMAIVVVAIGFMLWVWLAH